MGIKYIGKTAFDAVYDKYADTVYRTALYYSRNYHTAQEITQTIFLKLYENMDNINLEKAGKWLCTSAKYMALNYKKKREKEIPIHMLPADDEVFAFDDTQDVYFDKWKQEESAELIEHIFADLMEYHEDWYEALTIVCVLEKPKAEAAKDMGITYDNLRQMLHRAKKWIKQRYEKDYDHLNKA